MYAVNCFYSNGLFYIFFSKFLTYIVKNVRFCCARGTDRFQQKANQSCISEACNSKSVSSSLEVCTRFHANSILQAQGNTKLRIDFSSGETSLALILGVNSRNDLFTFQIQIHLSFSDQTFKFHRQNSPNFDPYRSHEHKLINLFKVLSLGPSWFVLDPVVHVHGFHQCILICFHTQLPIGQNTLQPLHMLSVVFYIPQLNLATKLISQCSTTMT